MARLTEAQRMVLMAMAAGAALERVGLKHKTRSGGWYLAGVQLNSDDSLKALPLLNEIPLLNLVLTDA